MIRSLPDIPNIDHLRKEAKRILRKHSQTGPVCCRVLRRPQHFMDKSDAQILATPAKLTEVQFALAMDYGFDSWNRLIRYVNGTRPPDQNLSRYMSSRPDELKLAILKATGAHDLRWAPGTKANGTQWNGMEFMRSGGKMLKEWDRQWADSGD